MNQLVFLSLVVAIMSAIQILLMKRASQKFSDHTLVSLFAVVYFVLMLGYIGFHRETILGEIQNVAIPLILIVAGAAITSFISNLIYYHLLANHPAPIVTALISTVPIFLVLFSYIFLRETMTVKHIAGIIAVIGGVILIS